MKKATKAAAGIAVICAAMGVGLYSFISNNKKEESSEVVSEVVTEAPTEPETEPYTDILPKNWAEMYSYSPSDGGISEKSWEWLRRNKDYIGWLRIDGTFVDYPVMMDPGETEAGDPLYGPEAHVPNSFYLDHNWDRSFYRDGAIYMDCKDTFDGCEKQQSENLVIYGHNMANGAMFGTIRRYRQDTDFYYDSAFVELSNLYKQYGYVVFSFFVTPGSYNATDFVYWNMEELDTKEEFDAYVKHCKDNSQLDTGIDVQYGDQLLTLSTCYADYDNSRFIVVARRMREGEVYGDISTIQCTKEYLKKHPNGLEKPKPEKDEEKDETAE